MTTPVRPAIALYAFVLSIAMQSIAIPLVGGYFLKFDWFGAIILCLGGLVMVLRGRAPSAAALSFAVVYLFYLLLNGALVALSGALGDESSYISYLLQFVLALAVFVFIASRRLPGGFVEKLLRLWTLLAAMAGLLAIVQIASGDLLIDRFVYTPYNTSVDHGIAIKYVAGILAATAWFAEASHLGDFLVVPFLYAFNHLVTPRNAHYGRGTALFLTGAIGAGLFLTYSLTAFLAVAIGTVVVVLRMPRGRLYAVVVALLCVFLAIIFADHPRVALQMARFQELALNLLNFIPGGNAAFGTATSFSVRSIGFHAAFVDFLGSPFWGVGLGQGSVVAYHSGFMTLLAQQGLIGVVLYYTLPVLIIRQLLRIRSGSVGDDKWLASFLIAALLADYASGSITHHSMSLSRWLLISLTASWVYGLKLPRKITRPRPHIPATSPLITLSHNRPMP